MRILVTGADGFVGQNLLAMLKAVRDRKVSVHSELNIETLDTLTREDTSEEWVSKAACADFVVHLAGVNRAEQDEALRENVTVTERLLNALQQSGNTCPVLYASSVQATLTGRFADSVYGKAKAEAEQLIFAHGEKTGAKTCVYRFVNIFGKWCRPFYNSAVATFCHQAANDLPLTVNDRATELELVYIDDVVEEILMALEGNEHRDLQNAAFCVCPNTHRATLGEIADLLVRFAEQSKTLVLPNVLADRFAKNLYSTFLSYLPKEKIKFPLTMHTDERGSFTELLRTVDCGQVSVNVQKPNITKGQHWHFSKWELYMVVSGRGLVEQRKIGTDEVLRFEVSGERLEAIHILPGYTHSITNLSATHDLVTVMWVNEPFDPAVPDTIFQKVEEDEYES